VRLMNTEEDEDNDVSWSELQLLSNDIPTSPVPESPLLQDDSDDDDLQGKTGPQNKAHRRSTRVTAATP
jgi:hypothetical protein